MSTAVEWRGRVSERAKEWKSLKTTASMRLLSPIIIFHIPFVWLVFRLYYFFLRHFYTFFTQKWAPTRFPPSPFFPMLCAFSAFHSSIWNVSTWNTGWQKYNISFLIARTHFLCFRQICFVQVLRGEVVVEEREKAGSAFIFHSLMQCNG